MGDDQGFYGPTTLTWQLTRERVLLVGGPRALLLQLAHPLVAAGVADYSNFAADPLARLRRTLDATLAMVYGTKTEAQAAAATINSVHEHVRGRLPEDAGRFAAGTPYDATDPELLLWVHSTLVDTTFEVHNRYIRTLSMSELEQAYEESKVAARLLRVPVEVLPADYTSFRTYFDGMIASDTITVAPFQRALVKDVLYPNLRFVPKPVLWPTVAVTASLLPPKVRKDYGLEMSFVERQIAGWSRRLVRAMLPVAPSVLREMPQARRAALRIRGGSK
jgi:uncharacterized protein (DUF2236 family)